MAAEVVKVLAVPSSLATSECTDKVSKSRSTSETTEPLVRATLHMTCNNFIFVSLIDTPMTIILM